MSLSTENKLKTGFGISFCLLCILSLGTYWNIRNLDKIIVESHQTVHTLENLQALWSQLQDAETGQRGYLLTGRQQYLEPYRTGIKSTQIDFKALNLLLLRNQPQTERKLKHLDALIRTKLSELETTIQLRQTKGANAALQIVQSDRGKATMDKIRVIVQDLMNDVKQLQQQNEAKTISSTHQLQGVIVSLGLLGLGILMFSILTIHRDLMARTQAKAALEKSEAELKALFGAMTDIVLVRDKAGRCLKIAPTQLTHLYETYADMLGKTLHEAFPQAQADYILHCIQQTLETQKLVEAEYVLEIGDREVNISANFSPLSSETVLLVARDITQQKLAAQSIQESEERFRLALEGSGDGLWNWNIETGETYFSPQWFTMLGYTEGDLPLHLNTWKSLIHPNDYPCVMEKLEAHLQDRSIPYRIDYRLLTKSAEWKWIANFGEVVCWNRAGQPLQMSGTHRDINERKQLEVSLFHEKELAEVTLHSIGEAVIAADEFGKIRYVNPAAEAVMGYSSEKASGLSLVDVFKIVHEGTREPVENPIEQALRSKQVVVLPEHTILVNHQGCEIQIADSTAPIRDREGNIVGAVMVFKDVTQTRTLSRELSWQTIHDPLTQLINRQEFEQRIEAALLSAHTQGHTHGLCYLDLDQFKIINDACGHEAGDELLRQIAALLQSKVRKSDTLARLGGDEFGLLLYRCSLSEALQIANDMRECVQNFQFVWQAQAFKIGASIGLISIDEKSETLSSVLSLADSACYVAKYKGRNCVHVFQADDRELLKQRGEMQWVSRITQALEEDRFCLYYQSIAAISPTSAQGEHYEVLLRLRDDKGGIVPPMAFIPAAERYDLMHLIDRWVIRTLFEAQGEHYRAIWNQSQIQGECCDSLYSINLSGASLNDDQFIDFLHEQFEHHHIPPQLICFEITETKAIANLEKTNQFIQQLQSFGCRFALDDFGRGLSSFAYLKNLPVDYLKIDGAFIRNIVNEPVDEAMVIAMTQIGHVMGMKIIAEFVENDEILVRLKLLGLDYAQGYGIAKPCILLPAILNKT
jgi:diguanylate cyclase (GGDEF)-like protein/PAS domain S-box-containing protein